MNDILASLGIEGIDAMSGDEDVDTATDDVDGTAKPSATPQRQRLISAATVDTDAPYEEGVVEPYESDLQCM